MNRWPHAGTLIPHSLRVALALAGLTALAGCDAQRNATAAAGSGAATSAPAASSPPPSESASPGTVPTQTPAAHLTPELRDAMSPDQVYQAFKDGHARFASGKLRYRRLVLEVEQSALAQSPHAVVLSCIDSRVPVETIFDKRIGDVFSTRIAGNVINEDVLGGLEFAVQVAGAKLIMVLGHTRCGAVKGAVDDVKHGNLTALIAKIQPSVEATKSVWKGPEDAKSYAFVDAVAAEHVRKTITDIRAKSPELKRHEEAGKVKIVGAMYDIGVGKVTFYD